MLKDTITEAYDAVAPDEATVQAMLERLTERAAEAAPQKKKKKPLRAVILAAACVAVLAALGTAGYGIYQQWRLPKPEKYTSEDGQGIYQVHETATLEVPETLNAAVAEPLSDEYFTAKAAELLKLVGLETSIAENATVTRCENLYWAREEVEVSFPQADRGPATVNFDAEDGTLLHLFDVDWKAEDAHPCKTKEEAEAVAAYYYDLLPLPRGYVLRSCEEYDENYWSFDFNREVQEGLFSSYETVRIAIDPQTGKLNGCVVFHVPLLDDHAEGAVPLTQEQAEQLVFADNRTLAERPYELERAAVEVVLPNWFFTEDSDINLRASKVTRLAWVLVYRETESEFDCKVMYYIDYYTGEILGGDMT